MLLRKLGIALGLFTANLLAQPAHACSPPLPGFSAVRPEDNARVPANAVLLVQGHEIFPFEASWVDFDQFLPLPVSQQPGFGRVELEFAAGGGIGEIDVTLNHVGNFVMEPLGVHLFTDPMSYDTQGPVLDGVPTIAWEYREYAPGLCEPGGFAVTVSSPPARDDWGVAAYSLVLRDMTRPSSQQVVATQLAPRDPSRRITMVHRTGETVGERCYSIVVYDIAGNQQDAVQPAVCVNVGGSEPDAGTIDATIMVDAGSVTDAGTAADTGPGANSSGGLSTGGRGCTCAGPSQNPLLATPLALLFVALLRRRRPRA